MRYLLSFICLVASVFVFQPEIVRAANFSLSFDTHYTFGEEGKAAVEKMITLTNLTTANYPTEYYLDVPTDAQNIVAFDEEGKIESSVVDENGQKRVKVLVNKEALGFGKDLTIALSYETDSLASHDSNRWQIAIPGYTSEENVDTNIVTVLFPQSWGEPKRVIPPPNTPYTWILSERSNAPISLDFELVKTPTLAPIEQSSPALPLTVGVSIGVLIVYVLYEFIKRV